MSSTTPSDQPSKTFSIRETFGLDSDMRVSGFAEPDDYVPEIDENYYFNFDVTMAILAGFTHNRRVMLQGLHGTGKSTHIEQVAARLNWPCMRVNLDGHISRLDLVGKDSIVIRDDRQVTEFQEGILPWSLQRPMALVFDEYDAGRADVMFVIQRLLEREGKFTLLEQNKVITPHPFFRLFATANTIGLGNSTGLYHGSQLLNHAQIDRWNIVATLNYLSSEEEMRIVQSRVAEFRSDRYVPMLKSMIALATMTREGFMVGDLSTLMSPRTVISWAENTLIFGDHLLAFKLSFLNKCEEDEHPLIAEYFQRCFDQDLDASYVHQSTNR